MARNIRIDAREVNPRRSINQPGCVGKLKITNIELVESDCNAVKFFYALKKAFDNITLFVKLIIKIMFYDSITFVGNANGSSLLFSRS